MNPTTILGLLLAISVALNGWQYHTHGLDVAKVATAEQLGRDTRAAADACSASVDSLAEQGRDQRKETLAAIAAIGPQIDGYRRASNLALLARPDNPADLCGSLAAFLQREIREEKTR